jgi:NAD(P)-dependent dehydrogenase (short-subunit alcohol dehydrogenase family)
MSGEASFQTKGGAGRVPFTSSQPLDYLLGKPRGSGFGSGSTAEQVAAGWDGKGKVAIVTGASAGLGVETARVLAGCSCHVVLAVRDTAKGLRVAESIKAALPTASLEVMELELGSLASGKAFADGFKASGKPLHLLICNAGIMAPAAFTPSADGFESQFATNHLGHFLAVNLLLPTMVQTAQAEAGSMGRIVVLTSYGHSFSPLDPAKVSAAFQPVALASPQGYTPFGAYGISKLANILFARQLQQRIQAQGLPLLAVACHPGYIMATDLSKHMLPGVKPEWLRQFLLRTFAIQVAKLLGKTIPQGAATQVFLATAPLENVVGGEYYSDCNLEVSSVVSHSKQLAQELWSISEQLCKQYLPAAVA